METTGQARATLRIHGRVQGVFFRESARLEATRLGLQGFVRNLGTGEVEAIAEGSNAALESFIAWCHHGPSTAKVERVDVAHAEPTGEFQAFRVERTR